MTGLFGAGLMAALIATPASAERYVPKPPILLSPDLTEPWIVQLRPQAVREIHRKVVRKQHMQLRPTQSVIHGQSVLRPAGQMALRQSLAPGIAAARPVQQAALTPSRPQRQMDPRFLPTVVDYATKHAPGTIVIDTNNRHLYLVQAGGTAMRYGVGVGKPGFEWAGSHKVTRKAEWPSWRPPASMIAREKAKGKILPAFMEGGPDNPLGARALYLGSTLYRIHGTNQPWSIGHAVSSGCIRMRNEDVIDLYGRVGVGTKVVVI